MLFSCQEPRTLPHSLLAPALRARTESPSVSVLVSCENGPRIQHLHTSQEFEYAHVCNHQKENTAAPNPTNTADPTLCYNARAPARCQAASRSSRAQAWTGALA